MGRKRFRLKASVRQAVKRRSGGICEWCKKNPAHDMHHVVYSRHPNELPEDIAHICLLCHGKEHPKYAETMEKQFYILQQSPEAPRIEGRVGRPKKPKRKKAQKQWAEDRARRTLANVAKRIDKKPREVRAGSFDDLAQRKGIM